MPANVRLRWAMCCCGEYRCALGACWSAACSREAAARIGAAMGWDESQSAAQLEAFEIERASFLRKPVRMDAVIEAAAD